jgi:SAM-dependent methyltransferase
MTLCDLSRLDRLDATTARAFAERLIRLGVKPDAIAPFTKLSKGLPDRIIEPIRRYHLQRLPAPLGPILRAFFFMEVVAEQDLLAALGDDGLYGILRGAGLLVDRCGGVVCPLRLNMVNDYFIFSDDLTSGQEAVMGVGSTTATLIQAAWPSNPIGSALDVGCGAGTAAVLLAPLGEVAVGIDINPRAILLSRLNSLVAGTNNLELFEGDLFAPVQGRVFDLIVAQPPFVSRPDEASPVTFLYGGSRGDELSLRLLRELPPYLSKGGRAVLLLDWPIYDDVAPCDRMRDALGDAPLDLLVLFSTAKNLDEYVTFYASAMHTGFGPEFDQAVLSHRKHLERMGIRELRLAIVVVRRTDRQPWTHLVDTRPMTEVEPTGAQVDRLLAAQDLLAAGTEELLMAELALPPDTRFIERDEHSMRIEVPESRLMAPMTTSRAGADLLVQVDRCPNVKAAVDTLCERLRLSGDDGVNKVLNGIRGALTAGLLEIREKQ